MTELIGNWLTNSVGCDIELTPEMLGKACFDGKLFAQILVSYNVISTEYLKLFTVAMNEKDALSNLKKLCIWFKLLGIHITDQFLIEVANKSFSACLKLLYDLYICLENRENMYYMDSKKQNRILSEPVNRFQVSRATEREPVPDTIDDKKYLREILSSMKGAIQGAEKATVKRLLMDGVKYRASTITKKIMEEQKVSPVPMIYFQKTDLCDGLDIKAKLNEFEGKLSSSEGKDNSSQLYQCSPEDYISYLKLKRRKLEADKKLKLKMEKKALEDAWKQILGNQETELKNILSKKLLKQSDYEKQMILRLKRIRMKHRKFIENRDIIMDIGEKQEIINQYKSTFHDLKVKEMTAIEKQRIKELHQRLFKEKIRLWSLGNRKACWRIMEDIVDYSIIRSDYFKKNGFNMSKKNINELKFLFIKGVRLLSHDLKSETQNEEIPPLKIDDVRIQELSELEFQHYMNRVGVWCDKHLKKDPEKLNIIGFLVHRLLNLKYDFNLSLGTPADLPHYDFRIFLHHINDSMALEKLKNHLSKFKIGVIDVYTVINYFLNVYKGHIGIDALKDFSKSPSPLKKKHNLALGSVERKRDSQKSKRQSRSLKFYIDKSFQFPSSEDISEDKPLSDTARLGKFVYEILLEGGLLPDTFVCYLIIEYLKTLENINGFVLVNYPENTTQLAILEYMLTGLEISFMSEVTDNITKLMKTQLESASKKVDFDPVIDEESKLSYLEGDKNIASSICYSIEELAKLQNSNILPKPNVFSVPPPFESYFAKVILLQRVDSQKKKSLKKPEKNTELIIELDKENKMTLEKFYTSLGISHNFIYRNFDFSTLKRLITVILNILPGQTEINKNLENSTMTTVKPRRTGESQLLSRPMEIKKSYNVDWIQEMYVCNKEDEMQEEAGFEEDIIYPGHKDWEYTDLAISSNYANILATVWESIEYFFINNLKECFGLLKTVENRLMPYRNYIRKKCEECLSVEDGRTQVVTNFQLMLNAIDDRFRPMDTMKNELHYCVLKLKCDLWRMTDVKKFYCEQVLELTRNQNWITFHQIDLLRVFSFILQVEADRFADTLQLIEDYYYVCLLNHTDDDRLKKLNIPTIVRVGKKRIELIDSNYNVNKTALKQKMHGSAFAKSDKSLKSFDDKGGNGEKYYVDLEKQENPVRAILSILVSILIKKISNLKIHCMSKIDTVEANCIAKIVSEREIKTKRKKKVNSKGLGAALVNTVLTPDRYTEMTVESILSKKVFHEWSTAIENETNRLLYRVSLIEKRAINDLIEDAMVIENTFKEFEHNIAALYHTQILNTDRVCDFMRAAIEDEIKIQPLILLKADTLDIDPSVIVHRNPPPSPPPSLVELQTDYRFTISQLTNLFYKLAYVAPFGIVEQTFIQILEDMVCMGHEMGHCYLPRVWSSLSSIQIKDVVHRLFGDRAFIDWRLFIISGLDLDLPTLENILDMKNKFQDLDTNFTETVTYEQYCCVFLWFENTESWGIDKDLFNAKAKELIFKMFQVGENLMNYTDFLLAFCRDVVSTEGFAKALALADGCATVAWKQDLFHEIFQIEKENEKYNVAYGIWTILLARVFQITDTVIITEVVEDEENTTEGIRTFEGKDRVTQDLYHSEDVNSDIISADGKEITWNFNLAGKEKPQILWKSDVYFSTVLSLLILDIYHFPIPSDQIYDSIEMEEDLRNIFISKGKGYSIKLFTLMNDRYLKNLFSSYKCFQTIPLSQLLAKLLNEKRCSLNADIASFFEK